MNQNVFAYGILMLPQVVEALTGNLFTPRPAILHGYSRYIFKGKCYPGIIEDMNGTVEGELYLDIDDRTLSIIDWLEDTIYERHLSTVKAGNEIIQAITYVVSEKHKHKLDNTAWRLEKFIENDADIYIQKCIGYRKQWEREVNRS